MLYGGVFGPTLFGAVLLIDVTVLRGEQILSSQDSCLRASGCPPAYLLMYSSFVICIGFSRRCRLLSEKTEKLENFEL